MKRRIIEINEALCTGCGLCADACHEGAIGMVNGKAKLLRDDYCDGLGDCLPACPTGAIRFVEREAAAYDEAAVKENLKKKGHGCPGSACRSMPKSDSAAGSAPSISQLQNWPVQIKLAPIHAPWLNGAELLIAADGTADAYARFHEDFIQGKVTMIGCPKLDSVDYSEKLTEIFRSNDIRSITLVRMEVPCCGGLAFAVKNALERSGKQISLQVVVVGIDGKICD